MEAEPRRRWPDATRGIEAEKPRTSAFWSFLDEPGTTLSIVHVFADAASMDLHFEGADARARTAYEVVEPRGWELDGPASDAAVATLQAAAASSGMSLTRTPEYLTGFSRLAPVVDR